MNKWDLGEELSDNFLKKALFTKYSSKKKNDHKGNLDELINNNSMKWVIDFKDIVLFEESEEYMKRFVKFFFF